MKTDPVHQDDDGQWYFWIETWHDRDGPYETEGEARFTLDNYIAWLEER